MPKFKPYLTDDGSIGLYSADFKDIFHSRTGALSEAYEKFIIPANINNFLSSHDEINLLDICYGIGYNTKSFLNFLIKNKYIVSIYNDKISKTYSIKDTETIYSDNANISFTHLNSKSLNKIKPSNSSSDCNIDNNNLNEQQDYDCLCNSQNIGTIDLDDCTQKTVCLPKIKRINIDAIEMEKEFVYLSPVVKENCYNQDYKILPIVDELLFDNILKIYGDDFCNYLKNSECIKRNSKFFDLSGVKYELIYDKNGYNYTPLSKLPALLHNIYYRYISKQPLFWIGRLTCKNYQYISKRYYSEFYNYLNNIINFSFYIEDARTSLLNLGKKYDLIFLDAFTPAKAPCLWTVEFFTRLYDLMAEDGILLTYSNSARIRNAMMISGFHIGTIKNSNGISTGTIATKNKLFIEHNLTFEERGRLDTKSGIPYRDYSFKSTNNEILKDLQNRIENSDLPTLSQYMKGINNEI